MAESSMKCDGSRQEEHTHLPAKTTSTAQSAVVMDGIELNEVPNVEVRSRESAHTPQAAPTTTAEDVPFNQLSPEQQHVFDGKLKKEQAKKYFSLREGAFEKAVEECNTTVIDPSADGRVLSSWLLTEIDHWDLEKERIVLITEKKLIVTKYNFIGLRVDDCRKIALVKCDKVQIGRFAYPKNTMMMLTGYADNSPRTKQNGLRIHFGHFEPSLLQAWNPWSGEIPYVTFASHAICELVEQPPVYFQVQAFQKAVIDAISGAREAVPSEQVVGRPLQITEEEIPIWLYVGITAMINNQSKLGYCKDRGSVFW